MDEQVLSQDIEIAEGVDDYFHQQSMKIEDVQGALEAAAQAIVGEKPQELTEHQQHLVDSFKTMVQHSKDPVYAVADKEALEHYVDSQGILRSYKPLSGGKPSAKTLHEIRNDYGPNVWAVIEYGGLVIPGNEGLVEVSIGLAKKAVSSFADSIPNQFKVTAKGLKHYVDMAQRLRERLLELQPLLKEREFPFEDVFDYGAYSRFFQVNGESIGSFSEFQEAMNVQYTATRHVVSSAESYSMVVMQKILEKIQSLQSDKHPEEQDFVELRDSISRTWEWVWKKADITPKHGQTPQTAINAFPERKFTSIAPLLDNRYLVAHEPKNNGGRDATKITSAIKHYGATVVFDKQNNTPRQNSMNVPNLDDLNDIIIQTINGLNELKGLEQLAGKNNSFAMEFKNASAILSKRLSESNNPQLYGFVAEYFKLATAVTLSVQQPYIQMAWMYIRCAMVVISLVELAVLEEPRKRIVTARFNTKQQVEFSNPALESFQLTQKVLQAGKSSLVS